MKNWSKGAAAVFLTAAICNFGVSFETSASAETEYIPDNEIQQEISTYLDSFTVSHSGAAAYSLTAVSDTSMSGYDASSSYEIFYLTDIIENYTGDRFDAIIGDKAYYDVPYANEDTSGVITLTRNDNDALTFVQRTIDQDIAAIPYQAATLAEAENLIQSVFDASAIESVKLTRDSCYHMSLIYLDTTDGEYIIPYFTSANADVYTGITEGLLYTASDFLEWTKASFELPPAYDEDGNALYGDFSPVFVGGYTITPVSTDTTVPLWIYLAISGAVLAGAAITFIAVHRNKKRHHA